MILYEYIFPQCVRVYLAQDVERTEGVLAPLSRAAGIELVGVTDGVDMWSPLHVACDSMNGALVATLTARCRDSVQYYDKQGWTPAHVLVHAAGMIGYHIFLVFRSFFILWIVCVKNHCFKNDGEGLSRKVGGCYHGSLNLTVQDWTPAYVIVHAADTI